MTEPQTIQLRDYQEQAIDDIEASIAFGSTNLIIEAPLGSGKSLIIAGLCKRFNNQKIVILVTIEPLIDQIAFFLKEFDIDYSILKAGRENEFDSTSSVVLAMSQTHYARLDSLELNADILIRDEAHIEYQTKRTSDILDKIKPNTTIALSATPYDAKGFKLKDSDLIKTVSMKELTKQGYLAPIEYYVPRWAEKLDYSKVKMSGSDYSTTSLDEIIGTQSYIDNVIESMKYIGAERKKTLIFCSTIDMCNRMEESLQKANLSAAAYHSKKSKKENERIMRSFKNNEPFEGFDAELDKTNLFNSEPAKKKPINIIISVSKLSVGFSVNDIDLGIMMRKTLRRSLWNQQVGRVSRTSNTLNDILNKYNIKGQ